MIQGNRKNIFQPNFFFQVLSTYFVHLFYNMYELYEKNIDVEIMIMPRVKRRPILFWNK